MRIVELTLRDLRGYERASVRLGDGLTVVTGRNGAGKTNLLEGLFVACTGASCRTRNERELVRFGRSVARAEARVSGRAGDHRLSVALDSCAGKRIAVDGAAVEATAAGSVRPPVCVFLPDRLELVKGGPSLRRGHLDRLVSALWPARAADRRDYGRALAQRNALLARVRGGGSPAALAAWDTQVAGAGIALMEGRRLAVDELSSRFTRWAGALGLDGDARLSYRPRSRATTPGELEAELDDRRGRDLERGFTTHGPHRDELALEREGRALRTYGSQGQQRLALLSLLMAEREALRDRSDIAPLMLLDDVMSELDAGRRERLVAALREGGQAIVTATEAAQVPGADDPDVVRLLVADGRVTRASSATDESPTVSPATDLEAGEARAEAFARA